MNTTEMHLRFEKLAGVGWKCVGEPFHIVGVGLTKAEAFMEWADRARSARLLEDDLTPAVLPLKLAWPTVEKRYTQKFGQRPEVYQKWGLPGHEGVDIACPMNTPVFACANGVVHRVGLRWKANGAQHPYGYQVRIRHVCADGEFETIYAHLVDQSAQVREGQVVEAGQIIALGDNTGNSSASHLHLSLKKLGTVNGGYGELIDPEPFLALPGAAG